MADDWACGGGAPSESVSVAMITYNGERYIEQQLASIAEQTRTPDEVVVVDDGSSDATATLIRRSSSSLPLRLYENERRLGPRRNLDRALSLVSGDVVFLSDQDDFWQPTKVERMLATFDSPRVVMAFSDAEVVDERGRPLGSRLWDRVHFDTYERRRWDARCELAVLLRHNVVTGATVAARQRLIRTARPLPEHGWHDHWLALYAAATGGWIARLDEPLICYRLHDANTAGLPSISFGQWRNEQLTAWLRRQDVLDMLQELQVRLPNLDESVQQQVQAAVDFLRHRQSLTHHVWPRGRSVLTRLRHGDYSRFAFGLRSAALDIIKPQRP